MKNRRVKVNYSSSENNNSINQVIDFNLTLQTIDTAIIKYISDVMKPTVPTSNGVIPVPVLYANTERWWQVRKNNYLINENGKSVSPTILLRRTSTGKNQNNNLYRKIDANDPYFSTIIAKQYNSKKPFTRFDVLNNIQQNYQVYSSVPPLYVVCSYDVNIWTDFIQQMNPLVQLFLYNDNAYWGGEGFKFKTLVGDITNTVDAPNDGDRIVKAQFQLTVEGYVIPKNYMQRQIISKSTTISSVKVSFK